MKARFGVIAVGVLVCGLGFGVTSGPAQAGQGPSNPSLFFSLDRGGEAPERYSIVLEEGTGRGVYRAVPAATGDPGRATGEAETAITVRPAVAKQLFAAVPLVKSKRCDGHDKHIAQTGQKTLRYTQRETAAECTYNYSADDRVNTATTLFEAIAETMHFGDRLAAKLRFDRLGLDAEMDNLQTAIGEGRVVEVGNIAPVLEAIQNDERVMERVRRKATRLLGSTGVAQAQSPSDGGESRR